MKIKRIWLENYAAFRRTFEDDNEAKSVLQNLELEVDNQLFTGHIDLALSAPYDDWGDALFDVVSFKVLPDNQIIINVKYTGTVK